VLFWGKGGIEAVEDELNKTYADVCFEDHHTVVESNCLPRVGRYVFPP
jgi:hypothetical protein